MERDELDQLENQAKAEALRPHLMKHLVRNALLRWLNRDLTREQAETEIKNAETMLADMGYIDMVRMHNTLLGLDDDKETAV